LELFANKAAASNTKGVVGNRGSMIPNIPIISDNIPQKIQNSLNKQRSPPG